MIREIDHDNVREIQLQRPPVNAIDSQMLQHLRDALSRAESSGARAIVLSGSPKIFSAGLDVPALLTYSEKQMLEFWKLFYGFLHDLAASPLPSACAITGHSPAGGTVMAIFADWRVGAEGHFPLGLNEVQIGLPLPPVLYHVLARLIGPRQATQHVIRGELISPEKALSIGLLDELAPMEEVAPRAINWASHFASLPEQALRATRAQARADLATLFESLDDSTFEAMQATWFNPTVQANMQALVAKLAGK